VRTPAKAVGRSRAPTWPTLKRSRPTLSSTANRCKTAQSDARPPPTSEAVLDRDRRRSYRSDPAYRHPRKQQ
jgi:hypothetical protein